MSETKSNRWDMERLERDAEDVFAGDYSESKVEHIAVFVLALANGDEVALSNVSALMGSKGGARGGKARAAALSPERRSEIARKAARARWDK